MFMRNKKCMRFSTGGSAEELQVVQKMVRYHLTLLNQFCNWAAWLIAIPQRIGTHWVNFSGFFASDALLGDSYDAWKGEARCQV